jgi:hypothetical protein
MRGVIVMRRLPWYKRLWGWLWGNERYQAMERLYAAIRRDRASGR